MPLNLIAIGSTTANSATFSVTAAAPVTVFLKASSGGNIPAFTCAGGQLSGIQIQYFDDAGTVFNTGMELSAQKPMIKLDAPGSYRVRRIAVDNGASIGVCRSD